MLDEIIKKLLVLFGPFAARLVKALAGVTNNIKRSAHPINEAHEADAIHQRINLVRHDSEVDLAKRKRTVKTTNTHSQNPNATLGKKSVTERLRSQARRH